MNKIKVLEIVPTLSQTNGVAAYISNYYENINKEKFEFTFLVVRDTTNKLRFEELENKGAKIVEIPLTKNIIKSKNQIDNFFRNNQFDIVHCNVPTLAFLYLKYAKKYNCKIRIIHSHGTKAGDTMLKNIRNRILIKYGIKYANTFFACSKAAGKSMFRNKKYTVIHNAINYEKYEFNDSIRDEYRNAFNINNNIVIGCIGRYTIQKNQKYLINVMKELNKLNKRFKLYIIGGGLLENELKAEIDNSKLNENVILLGARKDINNLYNMFDIFVMPSLYEGLPVVGIEAQVNGLNCIFSNNITEEVSLSNNSVFLDIKKESVHKWVETLLNIKKERNDKKVLSKEYEIKYATKRLEEIFENLIV